MSALNKEVDNRISIINFKFIKQIFILFALVSYASFVNAIEVVTYYHNDALGSPVAATDEAGNVKWREEYLPYGERLLKEDNNSNDTWFTGKQEDRSNGLTYFGARWYDPVLGRFTGIDPVGFQEDNIHSWNRYAYANNNPYKFVDPDGRASIFLGLRNDMNLNTATSVGGVTRTALKAGVMNAGIVGVTVIGGGTAILSRTATTIEGATIKKGVSKYSKRRLKKLINKMSKNSNQKNGLNQQKTDQLRRMVEKSGGKLRNDGNKGVKGSSASKNHVQTEGLGKADRRHVWTKPGVK